MRLLFALVAISLLVVLAPCEPAVAQNCATAESVGLRTSFEVVARRVESFAAANDFLRAHADTMAGAAAADRDLWVLTALAFSEQGRAIAVAQSAETSEVARQLSANAISPDTWAWRIRRR